ncbi:MAG: type II toxin-antitoxin system VapC family toxin [Desulfovibrionaceae bacterium]|nr:type II toxin-antitoxin system VapC family toxin [Desulfovibrionaceae bacterium]
MSGKPRYYWDSCTWIGLIKQEKDKFVSCKYIFDKAEAGEVEILASTLVLVEVYKTKCDNPYDSLPEEKDEILSKFFQKEFIVPAEIDSDVALCARKLLRYYDRLMKPQDAIHLATAILNDADELHTFDGSDLLHLNGEIIRMDGTNLKICQPPLPPDNDRQKYALLEIANRDKDEKN